MVRISSVVGVLIFAAWLWVFRDALFFGEVCALRDAGNFYYPLFQWECAEWAAGRIPLWNPNDGLGTPVLADATSSVLYPGKVIFALPVSFNLRFTLYVAGHILLAAWSVYFVARRWGSSELAAGIAAASYAFGGYVLLQHCNPVFLVSAAWLPLAVWLADEMLVQRSPRRAAWLGVVLALMTLGGDPQTACHAGMLAAVYAALLWRFERLRPAAAIRQQVSRWDRFSTARPVLLGLAAISAAGVAAVQILPTWEWTRHSDRVQFDLPRNVYEVAGLLRQVEQDERPDARPLTVSSAAWNGIFGAPHANTHAARMYYYSIGPWRLIELFWPNIAGRMFPIHHRWMSTLPGERMVWTPTLYLGLIPLLMAVSGWLWSDQGAREQWLKWMIALGIVGSFGWYGLGWLVHEIRVLITGNQEGTPWMGQPVGGLYWLVVTLLPGYAYFRYPAKWFVIAALGCSLCAARGTDRLETAAIGYRPLAKYLSLFSLALAVVLLLARQPLVVWLHTVPASNLYGPIRAEGAWFDMLLGLLLVSVESGLLWFTTGSESWRKRIHLPTWLFVVTVVDLVLANQWLVATVPGSVFATRSSLIREGGNREGGNREGEAPAEPGPGNPDAQLGVSLALPKNGVAEVSPRILHIAGTNRAPESWKQHSHPARLAEMVTWERDLLLHRHHLALEVAALDAPTTIQSAQWVKYLQTARRKPPRDDAPSTDTDFDWLGVDFWIERPSDAGVERPIALGSDKAERHATLPVAVRNSRRWPRVWLTSPDDSPATRPDAQAGTCRIVRYEPQRVEVEVSLTTPATLVLSDAFDPNWVASRRDRNSTIQWPLEPARFRELVLSVDVPAGEQFVVFRYRPRWFYWGAGITLISMIAIGLGALGRGHTLQHKS